MLQLWSAFGPPRFTCYTSIGSVSVKAHYQPLEAG